MLKRKRQKIELDIAQDERNKEILATQILALQEKQRQIDSEMERKKNQYAKICSALEQSDLGLTKIIDSLQVLLSFAASKTDSEGSD